MTAVVGILNKQAIAIAADSAVTIGGSHGRKIFNQANKVFTLSKKHPVAVIIYNSATFMNTPWETIIKVYRNQLKDTSFGTLAEYQGDFIQFLRKKNFYTNDETQTNYLFDFVSSILQTLINDVSKNDTGANNLKDEILLKITEEINLRIQGWTSLNDFCVEFEDYDYQEFIEYSSIIFDNQLILKEYNFNSD